MRQIVEFLKESRDELLKVNWPSRKQLIRHTFAVIAISFLVAVFLGILDSTFSFLAEKFLFQ